MIACMLDNLAVISLFFALFVPE